MDQTLASSVTNQPNVHPGAKARASGELREHVEVVAKPGEQDEQDLEGSFPQARVSPYQDGAGRTEIYSTQAEESFPEEDGHRRQTGTSQAGWQIIAVGTRPCAKGPQKRSSR